MADPVVISCPAGVWTQIATNVTEGVVHILKTSPDNYLQTYRDTGNPAPSDLADAVPFKSPLQISAAAGIDVYVYAAGEGGSVRVGL